MPIANMNLAQLRIHTQQGPANAHISIIHICLQKDLCAERVLSGSSATIYRWAFDKADPGQPVKNKGNT